MILGRSHVPWQLNENNLLAFEWKWATPDSCFTQYIWVISGISASITISFHLPEKHWNKGNCPKIMPPRRWIVQVWHPWIFLGIKGLRDPPSPPRKNPRVFFPGLPGGYWMTQALAMSNAHHLTTDVQVWATGSKLRALIKFILDKRPKMVCLWLGR